MQNHHVSVEVYSRYMIPLTFLEYEMTEQPDQILDRLNWSIEKEEQSWIDQLISLESGYETQRKWIGEIDRRDLRFSLEESGSLLRQKLKVVVKGEIELRATTTNVKIKLGLDNFSFFTISLFYIVGIIFSTLAILDDEFSKSAVLFIFIFFYPVLGTILIYRRMKRTERRLDQLFA